MKNLFLPVLAALFLFFSCSKKPETEFVHAAESNVMLEEPKPVADSANTILAEDISPETKGLKLIEGTDCLSCHKTDTKLIGPSYQEVAAKYTDADIDMLAKKIIEGGKGNWGEIPMTPHERISKEEAKLMVKYILSLKNL